MEDFGYQKEASNDDQSQFFKKLMLVAVALVSISGFVYFTISAYKSMQDDGKIQTIKSPILPIKINEENYENEEDSAGDSRQIYEDIFGSKNSDSKSENLKIHRIQEPVNPPKEYNNNKKTAEISKNSFISKPDNSSKSSNQTQEIKVRNTENVENLELSKKTIDGKSAEKSSSISKQKQIQTNLAASKNSQKIDEISDAKNKKINSSGKEDLRQNDIELQKTKKVQESKTSLKKRTIRVQVSAMSSEDLAEDNWQKISDENPSLFRGLKPFIVKADLGKRGVFYRLQIGEFYNQVAAEEFCTKFVSKANKTRSDCIIVD